MHCSAANAVAGICEYLTRRYMGRRYEVSRLFMYYNGRMMSKTSPTRDIGVFARDVVLSLRKYGVCEESLWPYDRNLLHRKPSRAAYEQASRFTVVAIQIPPDIKSIETCLHNQIPVLVDVILFDGAGTQVQANRGVLPMPNLNNRRINLSDLHTVLLVGYDRDRNHFIVRNSWGKNWVNEILTLAFGRMCFSVSLKGCEGYFRMPYAYLRDERLCHPHDGLWSIARIVPRGNNLPPIRELVRYKHH